MVVWSIRSVLANLHVRYCCALVLVLLVFGLLKIRDRKLLFVGIDAIIRLFSCVHDSISFFVMMTVMFTSISLI